MNVIIDSQILILQKYGGISRYFFELAKRYQKMPEITLKIPTFCSRNYYFEKYFNKKSCKKYFTKTTKAIKFINKKITCHSLSRGNYDILHPTYYSNYFLNNKAIKSKKTKIVVTVYDMIHEIFPEYFPNSEKFILQKKKLIYAADKIIAISESTKKDILMIYPDIPEEKINVIYLASSMDCEIDQNSNYEFDKNFVLFVGGRDGYKNFETFIEAFSLALKKKTDLHLLCVGEAFNETEINKLKKFGIWEVTRQATLSDSDLAIAYQHAFCFVFPSKYEGFGIPVLEAFENNCPVLLSNVSSLPEIGGDAAIYFSPTNVSELAEKICDLSDEKRIEMIEKGKEQYKKFSWDKCANETLKLYKKLL